MSLPALVPASGQSRPELVPGPAGIEAAYALDRWDAQVLGVQALRGRSTVSFAGICQPWLRAAVKSWCRWRLGTGGAFGTVSASVLALGRFSAYLAARDPAAGPEQITRELIGSYVSWLAGTGLAPSSRAVALVCLRGFLISNRRHRWLPSLAPDAMVYQDDLPRRAKPVPRFASDFVMAQLENETNLARLEVMTRNLLTVIMETGLRAGDATVLPFDPLVDDSVGWPCLRYLTAKTRLEQLVPLSARAAAAIRSQQAEVTRTWPDGSPWLFPATAHNQDAAKPVSYQFFRDRLNRWELEIGLHDEHHRPVRVTAHQFRHTLGTRLINAGVPQFIVQRVLGHASPGMTAVYAQLHDSTVRDAFERYQKTRVNIEGELLSYDPGAPTAQAEWVKFNLGRVMASLPNGYCGRPPQQHCPHPNACLTCPDFQTTVEFLDIHRRQAESNATLLAAAEARGHQRLAGNHRRVQDSLEKIITALEAVQVEPADDQG
jgi:site-specific recombinase XerD